MSVRVTILALLLVAGPAWAEPRFGTLQGIREGQRFPLVDPTTGKLDRGATVVRTGQDALDRIPVATVRFASGHQQRYAADRLHLVGQPFGVKRRYLRGLKRQVARAIQQELGVRADHVPVTTLRGRNTPPAPGSKQPLGPFLRAYLGDQPVSSLAGLYQLEGWHDRGRTYLHRAYAGFTRTLRLHETLHALSRPFTEQCRGQRFDSAGQRGMERLFEAITDYFAWHVAGERFGIQPVSKDPRYDSWSLGQRVAQVVGHERLKAIYLGRGPGLVKRLARAIDGDHRRTPFSLERMAGQLGGGDWSGARQTVSGF